MDSETHRQRHWLVLFGDFLDRENATPYLTPIAVTRALSPSESWREGRGTTLERKAGRLLSRVLRREASYTGSNLLGDAQRGKLLRDLRALLVVGKGRAGWEQEASAQQALVSLWEMHMFGTRC